MSILYDKKEYIMAQKVLLLAFRGELMCFAHVLIHAIDMHEKGYDVKIIIEGAAIKLIPELSELGKPFSDLFSKVRQKELLECTCKACAAKMGVLERIKQENLTIKGDVLGHPGLTKYIELGYQIITF